MTLDDWKCMVLVSIMVIPEKVEKSSSWNTSTYSIPIGQSIEREKRKKGIWRWGALCGNRGNMSPGMLGISDWGIMIHLFFLHLPTQKRCWSFFISLGRKAREGLDSIFQGEHARCIPHILLASSLAGLGQPLSPASAWPAQPPKNTHKSYIIIPGKTPLTQDCSFFSQLLG